jgi:hypothetical protein
MDLVRQVELDEQVHLEAARLQVSQWLEYCQHPDQDLDDPPVDCWEWNQAGKSELILWS